MKRFALIFVSVILGLSLCVQSRGQAQALKHEELSSSTWLPLAAMPTTRGYVGTDVLDGKIYVAGGNTGASKSITTFEVYDPESNLWSTLAPLPAPRNSPMVAAVNGKLYVFGGLDTVNGVWTAMNSVFCYDPLLNIWSTLNNMPSPLFSSGNVVLNGLVYLIGGGFAPLNTIGTNAVLIYDPLYDSWSNGASMPTARIYLGAAVWNDKIYAIGGYSGHSLTTVEEYSISTNTWRTASPLTTGRWDIHSATRAFDGKIYVVGGCYGSTICAKTDSVVAYRVADDAWEIQPNLPVAKSSLGAAIVNGRLYAAGGYLYNNLDVLDLSTYSITGEVKDSAGNGIPNVSISDNAGHTTVSNSFGVYTLSGLVEGTYIITPTLTDYTFSPIAHAVSVPPVIKNLDFLGTIEAWTLMFYLAGDSVQTDDPAKIIYEKFLQFRSFNQLESVASNRNIKIFVVWDQPGENNSAYYLVQPDNNPLIMAPYIENVNYWPKGELNMGDPNTLTTFVNWARSYSLTTHYALILNDHGNGLAGAMLDETPWIDLLTLNDLRDSLNLISNSGQTKIDVLVMSACDMGMIEDAFQWRNFINYYIASQNVTGIFFGYEKAIPKITGSSSGLDVSKNFADSYAEATISFFSYTMSVADTTQLDLLILATNQMAGLLHQNMSSHVAQMDSILNQVQRFDSNGDRIINSQDIYIDLYDFARLVNLNFSEQEIKNAATEVMNSVTGYILYNKIRSTWLDVNVDKAHGVSIFFPAQRSSFYVPSSYEFAGGADWINPYHGVSLSDVDTLQWGPMLVDYFNITQPNGPDTPFPPNPIASVFEAQIYLPLLSK